MLNVQAEHANSKRYLVSQQKSSIVVMNGNQNYEWTFNNENLPVSESVTHFCNAFGNSEMLKLYSYFESNC